MKNPNVVIRAPTENDLGCNFPARSAAWMGADRYSTATACEVQEFGDGFTETLDPLDFAQRRPAREGIREAEIRYTWRTATTPETLVTVTYRVNAWGKIKVSLDYQGATGLPELPAFGLELLTAQRLDRYRWDGLSGETYPDRYRGAQFGSHTAAVAVTPYLVPQECGNHKDTYRLRAGGLTFLCEERPFHCSVLPAPSTSWPPQSTRRSCRRAAAPLSAFWARCGAWAASTAGGAMWRSPTASAERKICAFPSLSSPASAYKRKQDGCVAQPYYYCGN